MSDEIRLGDSVIVCSPYSGRRGPFQVRRVDRGLVWVKKRRASGKTRLYAFLPEQLIRLKPGQTVKEALMAAAPVNQRCEICGYRPAPERHFVTVPFPRGFMRVCIEDLAEIKEEIRKRVADIVAEVFEKAKREAELIP